MRRCALLARAAVLAVALVVVAAPRPFAAALYQAATIEALTLGVYDGRVSFAELARHGDFGLGTLAGLDGEMVALDGVFHQVRHDGTVHRIAPAAETPFAQVVFFKGSLDFGRVDGLSLPELTRVLASRLPDSSRFYAVRVDGAFASLTARSVAAQKAPWPPLATAIEGQALFPMEHVQGTLVGFYTPPGAPALSPPGWHFHFLTNDRTRGGHVLAARLGPAKARGEAVDAMTVVFPEKPLPRRAAPKPAAGTE